MGMVEGVISITNYQLLITNYQTEILHHCHCLDAVAHGGNPQDRAASLILGWAVPTNGLCKLHYLSAALPSLNELITNY
ncbi:hypothetical protein [Moorena producens]|uniref:hypothetical protein n=1 Tax=Moorena producens TaxID=1155739 RepID=UPI003C73CD07